MTTAKEIRIVCTRFSLVIGAAVVVLDHAAGIIVDFQINGTEIRG